MTFFNWAVLPSWFLASITARRFLTPVFTDDFITSETATKVGNDIEAMELAIGAEKDSILFYYGMNELMPQRAQSMVSKIISEEKSHLRQLAELKKKLIAL